MRHAKMQDSVTKTEGRGKQATKIASKRAQMSDLKQVYSSHYTMFKELIETMLSKVKEGMIIMSHQIRKNNRDRNYQNKPNGNSGVEKSTRIKHLL